jgi:hypothetical protein
VALEDRAREMTVGANRGRSGLTWREMIPKLGAIYEFCDQDGMEARVVHYCLHVNGCNYTMFHDSERGLIFS